MKIKIRRDSDNMEFELEAKDIQEVGENIHKYRISSDDRFYVVEMHYEYRGVVYKQMSNQPEIIHIASESKWFLIGGETVITNYL